MADARTGLPAESHDKDFVALPVGTIVGRYEITDILGKGGFGITYRARDAQLNRDIAIKEYLPTALAIRHEGITVLPNSTKSAEDFAWGRQRFVDEGRTLASLQHAPAIVQVFDFLEANGTAYIVMRLVPGDTLENRLKKGTLGPAEIDRILWPLLDGLEQVHNAGFLHRDIKPANILLDSAGNPTLIDFGASRAAIAGRTTAMTAIFTPGYAAAEQMTSARQGPWTDIYGISATLYHAIIGAPPPSAFDRMLDDAYKPLAQLAPEGFSPGLLVGIDAGLAVRATDRPQSIAGWRPILGQTGSLETLKTVAMAEPAEAGTAITAPRQSPPTPMPAATPAARRGAGLWIGAAAVVIALAAGGGYWWYSTDMAAREQTAVARAKERAARQAEAKAEAELQKMREAQAKADQQKRESDIAQQAADKARQQILAEQAAKEKTEAVDRASAESAETALHLSPFDRQHIQVALTALGYDTNATDGVFGQKTRDMIAAWQTRRSDPPSGFLTAAQQQSLLRDAATAIVKFDTDQKKSEQEAKAKAQTQTQTQTQTAAAAAAAAAPPPAAAGGIASLADGHWRGTYQCTPSGNGAGPFTIALDITLRSGSGRWVRPGSGPGTNGNQSIELVVRGNVAAFERIYVASKGRLAGTTQAASLGARFEGNTITGSGPEANSGGRSCNVMLTR